MSSQMVSYPLELRRGAPLVRLVLPADLRSAEVVRLTAFLMTLVVEEEQPCLTPRSR
jgi:hypothetical protein